MRAKYWSCTKMADYIRGTDKLKMGTSNEWNQWEKEARDKHPILYWIAEEGLDMIQSAIYFIPDKLHSIKYYINNRWVTRTHALTANPRDIKPGNWCDVGNRLLPCLFNELQNFVEVELAWWHIAWADKSEKIKYKPPFWASGWFRWRTWRCPQAGLDNLEWQRQLRWTIDEVGAESDCLGELTQQAKNAQEILDLYKWWTEVYPNRPDPHDASGWTEYCSRRRGDGSLLDFDDRDPQDYAERSRILDLCYKIEEDYRTEDTEMMTRLIRIRDALWT